MEITNREKILAATDRLFRKHGVKRVSMDDIAKECGMSKKTIYQDFASKEELTKDLVSLTLDFDEIQCENLLKSDKNAILKTLDLCKYIEGILSSLTSPLLFDLQKYYQDVWQYLQNRQRAIGDNNMKQILIQGQKEGLFSQSLDTEFVVKLFVESNMILVNEDIYPSSQYDKVELYHSFYIYFLRSVTTIKGREIITQLEKKTN